ncbi:MAG TPA: hypothetical protein VMO80_13770 [Terriglobales bacterium]|jgi:hypothetical protein|nr:hypothetical protein [Terriglobales bacterium]
MKLTGSQLPQAGSVYEPHVTHDNDANDKQEQARQGVDGELTKTTNRYLLHVDYS